MFTTQKTVVVLLLSAVLGGIMPSSASADGLFSLERSHKYLGFGTVALAGMTAATGGDNDAHKSLAGATAACALTTVLTGYLAHSDRFDKSEGFFSKENRHIIAATAGAALLTTAVLIADDGKEKSHAGLGATGGILMTIAIIDIKW